MQPERMVTPTGLAITGWAHRASSFSIRDIGNIEGDTSTMNFYGNLGQPWGTHPNEKHEK